MPTKTVTFNRVDFPREVIEAASEVLTSVGGAWASQELPANLLSEESRALYSNMQVRRGDTLWQFDDSDEFFADLASPYEYATLAITHSQAAFTRIWLTRYSSGYTEVAVGAHSRGAVERIMAPFHSAAPSLERPEIVPLPLPVPKPVIFIGHGRSPLWRDVKDHLVDLHKYEVQAYETGERSGHTIRDVLSTMLDSSTFAILVMTSEDEQADETMRARQNVVHEAGLFQGRLGFPRVAILREEGVDLFSNIDGIQYIPFSKGNIRETFGDILATLKREFDAER